MKSGRVLIAAVLFLVAGVWIVMAYCQGTVGASVSSTITESKLSVDITTTGLPMLIGVPLTLIGLLLLIIALIASIVGQFQSPKPIVPPEIPPRRGIPFEE